MKEELQLQGIELRYVLTMQLLSHGPASITELADALAWHGFAVGGRASKAISDALRWEMGYAHGAPARTRSARPRLDAARHRTPDLPTRDGVTGPGPLSLRGGHFGTSQTASTPGPEARSGSRSSRPPGLSRRSIARQTSLRLNARACSAVYIYESGSPPQRHRWEWPMGTAMRSGHHRLPDGGVLRVDFEMGRWVGTLYAPSLTIKTQIVGSDAQVHAWAAGLAA